MNDLDKERQTEGRKAWYAVKPSIVKKNIWGNIWKKKG